MVEPQRDYFRDYHRGGTRAVVGRVIALVAGGAVVVGLLGALTLGAPAAVDAPAAVPTPHAIPAISAGPAAADSEPANPAETAPPAQPPASAPPAAPRTWSIAVDTTGYQVELDQCLWVRMDLGIEAPLVGAHNYCGGSIVLEMAIGDIVTLSGTGLDGTYQVSEERDARAGDDAAAATAGFRAAVILQTCYWIDDGSEPLLALNPVTA